MEMIFLKIKDNPLIYEINTRVWLDEMSERLGRAVDLASVPDEEVAGLRDKGFDCVWLMGVWEPSPAGREIAAKHKGLRGDFERTLGDLSEKDIVASPYAVRDYSVSKKLGGNDGLKAFREKAASFGLGLILDFVPNHTAIDHPWVKEHPDYYVRGSYSDFVRDSATFFNAGTESEPLIIAHGKDPYFPGWTDTAQLNYFNPDLRKAAVGVLSEIADMCDGVRCDMAMLVMNGIHYQVWGDRLLQERNDRSVREEFWLSAIKFIKKSRPDFLFIAEAYWMQEGPLQDLGFDYTYDKALYDWLRHGDVGEISSYLRKGFDEYQKRCVRFIENHDEDRAASAFALDHHKSAALIASTLPGAALFHEGQLEGRKVKLPVQLARRPHEAENRDIAYYYAALLKILSNRAFHEGEWGLYSPRSAWEGNYTFSNFLIWSWSLDGEFYLVVSNFSPFRSQCYVAMPMEVTDGRNCVLTDLLGDSVYERDGCVLCRQGLYLDMRPWARHLFRFSMEDQPGF